MKETKNQWQGVRLEKPSLDTYIQLYGLTIANIRKLSKKECEALLAKLGVK